MSNQETVEELVTRIKATEQAEKDRQAQAIADLQAQTAAKRAADQAAVDQAAAERAATRQAAAAAEFDALHKRPALDAWLRLGGNALDFEQIWPEESQRLRLMEAQRQMDAARSDFKRNLYTDF